MGLRDLCAGALMDITAELRSHCNGPCQQVKCRAAAEIERLRELVEGLTDSDPCDLDHNQNCQAHMWFTWTEGREECITARAQREIRSFHASTS